jgi:aldehyde dehydrogenase
VLDRVTPGSPVMQEEIFGPILPVLSYGTLEEAMSFIAERPRPLALYLFTEDPAVSRRVTGGLSYGGGCINDTLMHLATHKLPFGGVGDSGLGQYHGKYGFDAFTHYKSVVSQSSRPDLPLRYPPYRHIGLMKRVLK